LQTKVSVVKNVTIFGKWIFHSYYPSKLPKEIWTANTTARLVNQNKSDI
jgi:hypothetical protein